MIKVVVLLCLAYVAKAEEQPPYEYQTVYIDSSLTHERNDSRNYRQRFLVNSSYWRSPDGPIFFYTGNEGAITGFWEASGWVQILAKEFGAMIVFGEARYYGASIPSESGYLETELILADYAEALRSPSNFVEGARSGLPVISFGGSFGGTLTTFFRASYPDLVIGGIAASAPVGYYDPTRWEEFNVSAYTFTDIVATAYEDCIDTLAAAVSAIDQENNVSLLLDLFDVCSVSALVGNSTPPAYSALFVYALESLPQLDYPYPVSGLPAYPTKAVCSLFSTELNAASNRELIAAAANITKIYFSLDDSTCMPALNEGPGGVPGDGPGLGTWGLQSCTETLHQFSSKTPIRNYTFDLATQNSICSSIYNMTPNTSKLTALYGGYDLPMTTTSLFFSNGALDPWHGGGFLEEFFPDSPNSFCFMPNGAHHLDLRTPNADADPQDVTDCRQAEEVAIRSWLTEFYSAKEALSLYLASSGSSVISS